MDEEMDRKMKKMRGGMMGGGSAKRYGMMHGGDHRMIVTVVKHLLTFTQWKLLATRWLAIMRAT